MFLLNRPGDDQVQSLARRAAGLEFTYPDIGATHDQQPPPGYRVSHYRVRLGEGIDCFRLACQAITEWRMLPDYLERLPDQPLIEADQCVVLRMRFCGLWAVMLCRIVYAVDVVLPMGGLRFGFAYGTLPGHPARGEERFLVELLADDTVWYDLYSFSRPQSYVVWLGLPICRYVQRRFALDSCRLMFEYANSRSSGDLSKVSE